MDLSLAQALLDFIGKSPSPFHVVDNLAQRLQEEGYTELFEHQPWNLEMGGCYYLRRNGSSLLSFRIPQAAPTGFLLSAAHSDSPSFKLKASAERVGAHYVQLETEGYGGMLLVGGEPCLGVLGILPSEVVGVFLIACRAGEDAHEFYNF